MGRKPGFRCTSLNSLALKAGAGSREPDLSPTHFFSGGTKQAQQFPGTVDFQAPVLSRYSSSPSPIHRLDRVTLTAAQGLVHPRYQFSASPLPSSRFVKFIPSLSSPSRNSGIAFQRVKRPTKKSSPSRVLLGLVRKELVEFSMDGWLVTDAT